MMAASHRWGTISPRGRAMLPGLLIFLALVEVGLPLLLFLGRDRLIFLPSLHPLPEDGLLMIRGDAEVRLVRVPRPDGRLLAAYDAVPAGAAGAELPTVIFFHGNAGNIGSRAPLLEDFVVGTGARTLLFDYSGYGGNEGSPSEEEAYRDGLAVYDHVVAGGVPPERIVLYGESLGAAVALEVASRRPCAGVLAQSPFSSVSSMALRVYPWIPLTALLARGTFPSIERVRELRVPLVVAHGTRDRIIPFEEGKRLYEAAPPGAELIAVENAGHNDFFAVAGPSYLRKVGDRVRDWTG